MSDNSRIEWTDATWSPVTGCTPISEACTHCYARRMAKRLAGRCGYPEGDGFAVTVHEDKFNQPLSWSNPRRIFVCSMGDLFHDDVPEWAIRRVFMNMALAHRHTFIVLTKRPQRMATVLGEWGKLMDNEFAWICHDKWPLPNVWLGVTAENQARANERIPILLDIPAAVHFVSVEPMLAPVDLREWLHESICPWRDGVCTCAIQSPKETRLDWVICGAETGPGKRWMNEEWAIDLRRQCQSPRVPFFMKKFSDGSDAFSSGKVRQFPDGYNPVRG